MRQVRGLVLITAWVASTTTAIVQRPDHHSAQVSVAASETFARKSAQLDELFRRAAQVGGSYILHYRSGQENFSVAYGSLDCAGTKPMPAEALFDGGSLTKNFTRAAVFKLVEEGRLKLDDRLGELFDNVPAEKARITVAQLLQHRSGIPNFIDNSGRAMDPRAWTIESYDFAPRAKAEMLRLAWKAPLGFRPGTREEYSNYGFNLLAAVIESASNEAYEAYVRRRVFLPLGMRSTGYLLLERAARPVAEQCREGRPWPDPYTGRLWRRGVSWSLMGAGGMYTSVEDLQRWNTGVASAALFRSDIQERFDGTYFGASYRCGTLATASGGSNGMTRSLIFHLPKRQEAVVAVGTRRENSLPEEAAIRTALCGK
jgi:CubicO group peptidase (beta-lactamase class C family)